MALAALRVLVFIGWKYLRLALVMRYLPRLLDALLRERVPYRFLRGPIVWWMMRQLLR